MENKLIHGSHSCEPNPGPPGKNSSFKDKKINRPLRLFIQIIHKSTAITWI